MKKGRVLVVDDEKMIRWPLENSLSREGYKVVSTESGEEAVDLLSEFEPDVILLDITLPGMDGLEVLRIVKETDPSIVVVMITAHKDATTAVAAMKLGAYDYIEKPFDVDKVVIIVGNAMKQRSLAKEVEYYRKRNLERYGFTNVIGVSPQIKRVIQVAKKVAMSEATTVLLQGESGTGKDLIAMAIHYESSRASGPFMPINVTALPGELLESELMGYEKGAFTDAKSSKKGLFEVAHGGTIYLDEIGDMPFNLQAKLLRFIETKTFKRVGGHKDIEVDVRIIAATNRNLEEEVSKGNFRSDLFYRLNVVPIFIPPLRERKEDIIPLAEHFLKAFRGEFKRPVKGFTKRALEAMLSYEWPGNVRELKNSIERAMILGAGEYIDAEDLIFTSVSEGIETWIEYEESVSVERYEGVEGERRDYMIKEDDGFILPDEGVDLEEVELSLIRQALEKTGWNQTRAAKMLGLSRDALRYRMKKFGL